MATDAQLRLALMQAVGGMATAVAIIDHSPGRDPWKTLAEVRQTLVDAANREPSSDSQVKDEPRGSAA